MMELDLQTAQCDMVNFEITNRRARLYSIGSGMDSVRGTLALLRILTVSQIIVGTLLRLQILH